MTYKDLLENTVNLGLSKKVQDNAKSKDAIDLVSNIQFEDPEVEHICHEHGVYTIGDARNVSSIKGWFSDGHWLHDQSTIKKFDELKYFTGLTSIGSVAFSYCRSLHSINIPDSVISIGKYAFSHCKSLQSVNLPDSVTSIGDCAFYNCKSLQSINISNSVTSIGNYAFYNCKSLQTVSIPDRVTSIGDGAFYNCKSLQSINIPDSVTSIGKEAFYWCESLQTINISKKSPIYSKIKKEYPNIQLVEPTVNESFIGQKDKAEVSITNSQGQDTIEPGKHSENVYLPDCPFLLGKEQVDWFEYFQQEKEKHTIKDVDDFIASAKKETKLIKES